MTHSFKERPDEFITLIVKSELTMGIGLRLEIFEGGVTVTVKI